MTDNPLSLTEQLAGMRNSLAIERTRLAAERTLMAMLRTSLSLIAFGFTLFSFFRSLAGEDLLASPLRQGAPARFGLALVVIGILVLVLGIRHELLLRRRLKETERQLESLGIVTGGDGPRSGMLLASALLLMLGVVAVLAIALRAGPLA